MEPILDAILDRFLAALLLIGAILVAIDWSLGKQGRARVRERIGDLWLHLSCTSYRALLS